MGVVHSFCNSIHSLNLKFTTTLGPKDDNIMISSYISPLNGFFSHRRRVINPKRLCFFFNHLRYLIFLYRISHHQLPLPQQRPPCATRRLGSDGKDSAQGMMGMGERKRHSGICALPTVPRARSSEIIR